MVSETFHSQGAVLTDSGTSALVLALRLAAPASGTVGLPAYGCVDLVAAALRAGVRVRLYDIDPATLSPDLDSVHRLVQRGVDAIVVAHLFGYAADVPGVQRIASANGVTVIEDAAQGAGGSLASRRLGSLGDLSVVSFGRGKGLCAAGGGALLVPNTEWQRRLDEIIFPMPGRGMGGLSAAMVQWILGRPAVYAIPSSIPWLHLGEMVYHPASEPGPMSAASMSLVPSAFALEADDIAYRRRAARSLDAAVHDDGDLARVTPIAGSHPGYLRYALRDVRGDRRPEPALGIVRPYPRALPAYPELAPVLVPAEPTMHGGIEIARTLLTLPTHRFVRPRDLAAAVAWMDAGIPRDIRPKTPDTRSSR